MRQKTDDTAAVDRLVRFKALVLAAERERLAHKSLHDEAGEIASYLALWHQPRELIEEARRWAARALQIPAGPSD